MCGIFGWLGEVDTALAEESTASLRHRGPDDIGFWEDKAAEVFLGHTRLSILDLSATGAQPMCSSSGRLVLSYNGEIYNFHALRKELAEQGIAFRGSSDTETLLSALELWGLEKTLSKLEGMFAFALWDKEQRELSLVRDRIGEKPLYYALGPGKIAFASELHALARIPWVDTTYDIDALHAYFMHLCIPAPATIFRGVRKLPPGAMLRWEDSQLAIEDFWNHQQVINAGLESQLTCSFAEAVGQLEEMLLDSVRRRMISDVPLGAFLSGGIDSSLVVALMQKASADRVRTFTIGVEDPAQDESQYAKEVASVLGTDHTTLMLTPKEILGQVPEITARYDEPFADSSSIPTWILCRHTRDSVKVALSGDGGDELFGGYPRYFWAERIARLQRIFTPLGARMLGRTLGSVPSGIIDTLAGLTGVSRVGGSLGFSGRVQRFAKYLSSSPNNVYRDVLCAWANPGEVLHEQSARYYGPEPAHYPGLDWASQMQAVDQRHFMVDDVLCKVDRASMSLGLEVRTPLLDYQILEWSWRLPQSFKLAPKGDKGKLILRELLSKYIPQELIDRPKKGFGVPVAVWMRGPLKEWVEDTLHGADNTVLRKDVVWNLWSEHLKGEDRFYQVWPALMFLQWQESFSERLQDNLPHSKSVAK